MSKGWLVAQYHFRQETSKRSFLIILFMLPLFLALSIGMGYLVTRLERESATLGYVDQAGLLVNVALESDEHDVRLVSFETRAAAQAALEEGQIDAYYVLASRYAETRRAELVYVEPPHDSATRYFRDVVRLNLMAGRPPAIVKRLLSGPNVTVRLIASNRDFPAGAPGASLFVPLVAAAMVAFLTLTTSGYMMEVLVAEKENRTIEIIVSSISPAQMMTGKIVGALGIALMQLTVWLVCLVGAVWVGGGVLGIGWLQDVNPNWRDVLAIVAVALPTYLFMAALMTIVGSTLTEVQEAQQAGPFFFLLLFLPTYLAIPLIQHPSSPLSVGLSLLPVTSVVTIAIRSLFFQVPAWEIAASAGIASACGALAVWLASQALRMSMLRYGQRLKWRDLFARRSTSAPIRPAQG